MKWITVLTTLVLFIAWANRARAEGHSHGNEHEQGQEKKAGFALSPEAVKNFGLETLALKGPGPWAVPASARLLAGEEANLFRRRKGLYRRIDFQGSGTAGLTIRSSELVAGDEIVVRGLGFLRIAEIAASGGDEMRHSH